MPVRATKPSKNIEQVFRTIKDSDIKVIDLRFCDMLGQWQHFTVMGNEFDEDAFTEGLGFDGSSIRGFQAIHESDMLLIPDPDTIFVDPFTAVPTLNIICDVKDPMTLKRYSRDSRYVARIPLERHGVFHIADDVQGRHRGERIDEDRVGIQNEQHVALVDRLEASD